MTAPDPQEAREGSPAEGGSPRRGFVTRLLHGLVHDAVKPLLDRLAGRVSSFSGELASLRQDVDSLVRSGAARQAEEDRRFDDLRAGFLATRGEFERLRDVSTPELSRRLDALASGPVARIQAEVEELRDRRLAGVEETSGALHAAIQSLQGELVGVRDDRLARTEADLAGIQGAIEAMQADVAEVRDLRVSRAENSVGELHAAIEALQDGLGRVESERVGALERQIADLHRALEAVQLTAEEIRDQRLPALAAHTEAVVGRLHEDAASTAGLLARVIAGEPLRVDTAPEADVEIPEAVREASTAFLAAFRGSEAEIGARLREYLPLLLDAAPVLDLGCGRGELLLALQEEGVAASGVERDPAMVAACRRRGLDVEHGDILDALEARAPGSLGAVTAVHVLEHLPAATWMTVVDRAARALRPGGLLIVECPNPDSLRVGAGLFWTDPTHRVPIHADAVAFVAAAVGLEPLERLYRRPFPPEQSLRRPGQADDVAELAGRLDAWLSGPRDYVVISKKP